MSVLFFTSSFPIWCSLIFLSNHSFWKSSTVFNKADQPGHLALHWSLGKSFPSPYPSIMMLSVSFFITNLYESEGISFSIWLTCFIITVFWFLSYVFFFCVCWNAFGSFLSHPVNVLLINGMCWINLAFQSDLAVMSSILDVLLNSVAVLWIFLSSLFFRWLQFPCITWVQFCYQGDPFLLKWVGKDSIQFFRFIFWEKISIRIDLDSLYVWYNLDLSLPDARQKKKKN